MSWIPYVAWIVSLIGWAICARRYSNALRGKAFFREKYFSNMIEQISEQEPCRLCALKDLLIGHYRQNLILASISYKDMEAP